MDISRVREYGTSRNQNGWFSSRVRLLVWRLIEPFVRGIALEGEESIRALLASSQQDTYAMLNGARIEFKEELSTIVVTKDEMTRFSDEIYTTLVDARENFREELTSIASSQVAGCRKDVMAIGHRLSSLEDVISNIDISDEKPANLSPDINAQGKLLIASTPVNSRFMVRTNDLIGNLVANGREWEPHVREAIVSAGQSGKVAVDVGAYIGLHTVTMSRHFREVHAFEPQRAIFNMLCGNLALNDCQNVRVHRVALYDRSTPMRIAPLEFQEISVPMRDGQIDYSRITNAAALTFQPALEGISEEAAITLDSLNLDDVALIKIDAQGADLRVLYGARRTLERFRPIVLFEWERDLGRYHGATLDAYKEFFAELNYKLVVLQETSTDRQADYIAMPG